MYNGDLFPIGSYDHCSQEYKNAMDKLVAVEAELLKDYPQAKELFQKYQDAQIGLISINNRQEFVNGFRIGIQIMVETFGYIK